MKGTKLLVLTLLLAFILGLVALPAAAGPSEQASTTPKSGGVLRIGTGQIITILGYTPMISNNSFLQFLQTSFDSLLFYDDAGNLVPKLAVDWETDAEAKTITFHLRQGVKFQDGTDFNAEAVKWNIEQYQAAARTEVAIIASIDVVDDYTVVLNLSDWNSSTLEAVGFFVYYMSPTAVQEHGTDWAQKNPVGTGPFVLEKWDEGVGITYTRNPDYWQEGKPYLDGIEYYFIAYATTLSAALQSGEIDMISYTSILEVENLVAAGFVAETNSNGVGVESTGVIPASANPDSPFADPLVRKAFVCAIDRDALIAAFGHGYTTATNQWAAPGSKTYNPDVKGCPYNPDLARQLLAEAGYPDGFDTVIFAFAGDTWNPAIAQMLNDVGIRAKIELADGPLLNQNMLHGWDGIMYHWASIGPDLGLYMGRHLDPSGAFFAAGIQHPQDALDLLQAVRTAPDEATKLDYEMQLQKLIYDKYYLFGKVLYVTPIIHTKYDYVTDDNFGRFTAASWTPENAWLDK
jgi:peptide/nickel transport system substrate-binding protein